MSFFFSIASVANANLCLALLVEFVNILENLKMKRKRNLQRNNIKKTEINYIQVLVFSWVQLLLNSLSVVCRYGTHYPPTPPLTLCWVAFYWLSLQKWDFLLLLIKPFHLCEHCRAGMSDSRHQAAFCCYLPGQVCFTNEKIQWQVSYKDCRTLACNAWSLTLEL